MLLLKIIKPGYTIAIPGMPVFRTPVEMDISKLDIRVVAMYLETNGISDYEILAETQHSKEVYTKKDFSTHRKNKNNSKKKTTKKEVSIDKRFERLEKMILKLTENNAGNVNSNGEQIINKLDELEKKMESHPTQVVVRERSNTKPIQDDIDEIDSFIPDVDISEMTLSSSDNVQKIKREDNPEDAADALAGLIGKKKKGGRDV